MRGTCGSKVSLHWFLYNRQDQNKINAALQAVGQKLIGKNIPLPANRCHLTKKKKKKKILAWGMSTFRNFETNISVNRLTVFC